MGMITSKQAAERWGVSDRTVQNYCTNSRITGAERWGRTWMIPDNALKPTDGRSKKEKSSKRFLICPKQTPQLIMSDIYSKPGSAQQCIKQLSSDPEAQLLFEGWLAYNQGNYEKAYTVVSSLLDVEADFYGTMNIAELATACAIATKDNQLRMRGLKRVHSVSCADETEKGIRDFWLKVNNEEMRAHINNFEWHSWATIKKLPADSLPLVLFQYTKHIHKFGLSMIWGKAEMTDVQGLGFVRMCPYIIEPLIAQMGSSGSLLARICLHSFCANAYFNIDMKQAGISHLDNAIRLAVPDKLYGLLAEFRELFGTMLDERLKKADPEAAKAVRALHKKMYPDWYEMINKSVVSKFSERQKEIGRLVSLGLTNKEIAKHLNVSYNTVKSTISAIMNKTGCEKRSEFNRFFF